MGQLYGVAVDDRQLVRFDLRLGVGDAEIQRHLVEERGLLMRERIRLSMIGGREGLPAGTLAEIDRTVELCAANDGMRLCLAVNYGSRAEIVEAARRLAPLLRALSDASQVDTNGDNQDRTVRLSFVAG